MADVVKAQRFIRQIERLTRGGPIYGEEGRRRARMLARGTSTLDRAISERVRELRDEHDQRVNGYSDPRGIAVLTTDAFESSLSALTGANMLESVDYSIRLTKVNGDLAKAFVPADGDMLTLGELAAILTTADIPFKQVRVRRGV